MPKITLLKDWENVGKEGEIIDKPDAWITHHARKVGEYFEPYEAPAKKTCTEIIDKVTGRIIGENDSKEKAFMQLSEGDRDSVRKGFKELVLRKSGWIIRDCSNKAMEEIHIMSIDRTEIIKDAKNSAIARAASELGILAEFKRLLRLGIEGEECLISCEDKEQALELVNKLSIGVSEVEVLKAEVEKLRAILKTK